MKEEELILKFLNNGYILQTDAVGFVVFDIDDKVEYKKNEVIEIINLLFGVKLLDGSKSSDVFNEWADEKEKILTKKLGDYLYSLDFSLGSARLLKEFIEAFANDVTFKPTFICNYFNDYYYRKILTPKIDLYVTKFLSLQNTNSVDLLEAMEPLLRQENEYQKNKLEEYLNKWYVDNIFNDKVTDLLSQFVLTLGSTDWIVTWIGHGKLKPNTLRDYFKKENAHCFRYALGMYEEWYEKEVIEMSEKYVKRNEL